MSASAEERNARTPWALTAPALMLFVGVLLIPLAMTVMLSFHDWGQYKGIEPVFILKNWHEIVTDPYYAEMFGRTFRIAILTTLLTAVLGAPEAYILNRMGGRWKSVFLLVILGPLLISVVARTLMSSGRQARRTASPSAGCFSPSFCRITIAGPHSLSHWNSQ